jgi:Phage P22-like portal protein
MDDEMKEIREKYDYLSEKWRKPQEERKTDLRYLMGDPWDPRDRKAREDVGRPCLSHDELRQYVNQAINSMRQNKRGIKVDPDGRGADDKTAELRQDLIRTIEYKCGAPYIYIASGFEQMIRGAYGFYRITRRYVGKTFQQEIVIKPLLNPDAVLFDWDCREVDWSDARCCFVLDWIRKDEFAKKYPKAEKKSFSADDRKVAPEWIHEDKILIAEYWEVECKPMTLYELEGGQIVDRVDKGVHVVAERDYEEKTLVQNIVNGVEIIKRIPQPGTIIPIIPNIGEEIWIDRGEGTERELVSLVRLARDPQMSLAYLVSQEAEEAKLTPKSPYIGYKGQFESDHDAWEQLTSIARAYVQVDPLVDAAGGTVLPLPRREQFTPNFGAYEIAKDSCRRAVMSAMGLQSMPTAAQRNNEKSGIALERIQSMQSVGSFHFADRFDMFLALAGHVINDWLDVVYAKELEVNLRKADDTTYKIKLNTSEPYIDDKNQESQYKIEPGEHHITVSSGPSDQSKREEVTKFLDLLVANLKSLPIPAAQQNKLIGQMIRMKQMGHWGDEMADIIDPKADNNAPQMPPVVMAQLQQIQSDAAQVVEQLKIKEAEIAELKQKLEGRVIDNQYKLEIERMKIEAELAKAEITTSAQNVAERLSFVEDMMAKLTDQAHEAELQARNLSHAKELASMPANVDQGGDTSAGGEAPGAGQAQESAGPEAPAESGAPGAGNDLQP